MKHSVRDRRTATRRSIRVGNVSTIANQRLVVVPVGKLEGGYRGARLEDGPRLRLATRIATKVTVHAYAFSANQALGRS